MKVLFDEDVPGKLARSLPQHQIHSVVSMEWGGLKDVALLTLIESERFNVFLTGDKNMSKPLVLPLAPNQASTSLKLKRPSTSVLVTGSSRSLAAGLSSFLSVYPALHFAACRATFRRPFGTLANSYKHELHTLRALHCFSYVRPVVLGDWL